MQLSAPTPAFPPGPASRFPGLPFHSSMRSRLQMLVSASRRFLDRPCVVFSVVAARLAKTLLARRPCARSAPSVAIAVAGLRKSCLSAVVMLQSCPPWLQVVTAEANTSMDPVPRGRQGALATLYVTTAEISILAAQVARATVAMRQAIMEAVLETSVERMTMEMSPSSDAELALLIATGMLAQNIISVQLAQLMARERKPSFAVEVVAPRMAAAMKAKRLTCAGVLGVEMETQSTPEVVVPVAPQTKFEQSPHLLSVARQNLVSVQLVLRMATGTRDAIAADVEMAQLMAMAILARLLMAVLEQAMGLAEMQPRMVQEVWAPQSRVGQVLQQLAAPRRNIVFALLALLLARGVAT
mmetsp:Transcript_5791/g.9082  ORF Transcript_5791/g.9082 Transcript_5791/m.9082 type:complete len:356 (-) Transcript_5791:578-1645(-)